MASTPGPPLQRPFGNQFFRSLRQDLPASLVVFLVALPLSLGIAAASNAPIMAGLIAAAVGGIVAGALGGSSLQVSGPAAGLTVIVAGVVGQFGWRTTTFIVMLAGAIQLVLSISRVARVALAISPVVVQAMLAGIGITIVLQQVHVLLGHRSRSSAWGNLSALPSSLAHVKATDAALGLAVIAILVAWMYAPASIKRVPGQLVAVVAVTAAAALLALKVRRINLDGSLIDAIALPQLPNSHWLAILGSALTVAVVASVESLLSAIAVDRMHHGPRADLDRELRGQGAANLVSGALGGLPVTGVIVRSATNVTAGAVSRTSAILHGVWVLVFAIAGVALIEQVPFAALAGLLIMVGIGLVKRADIVVARRTGDLVVYAVTVVAVVFLNLLEGVGIGIALSLALLVWRVVRVRVTSSVSNSGIWRVVVEGSCSFLSVPRLMKTLHSIPDGASALIELDVDYLDHAAHRTVLDWAAQHEAKGGQVVVEEHGEATMANAADATPRRSGVRESASTHHAPWSRRHDAMPSHPAAGGHLPANLIPLARGVDHFHRRIASDMRPYFESVAKGQAPDSLFLTCADSRVVPNLITGSGPGDLFTVRNVGNLVPSAGSGDTSVSSALDFGINQLGVGSVIVCGHSGCGAMNALLAGHDAGSDALSSWLSLAMESLAAFRAGHPVGRAALEAGYDEADALSMTNVAVQVARLQEHPAVDHAVHERDLTASGVFFDIANVRVLHIRSDRIEEFEPGLVQAGA